ncbi:MAG: HAD family hydrolase [Bacteriovoracia bacterium]
MSTATLRFDQENEKRILEHIEASKNTIAVFDADGTLWRGDVGESFLKFQIENNLLTAIPSEAKADPWSYYWRAVKEGRAREAYGWPVSWNAGRTSAELSQYCAEFFEGFSKNIFSPMRWLVEKMQQSKIEVWVVSASMRWIVEEGAKAFGIGVDKVIGASVSVIDGVLTSSLEHPVPYREEKAKLIKRFIGSKNTQGNLSFGAGNTYWDKEMVELAKMKLAVCSEHPGEPNYGSEQELQKLANSQGWLQQRF